MSEPDQQSNPASFYASPQEACHASPEEFLYLACMPGDNVVVSMLGDRDGGGAGGFSVLDAQTFELRGRWENGGGVPPFNYDFWYQPRRNVPASSEFGEPNAYEKGFDIEDVGAGCYGSRR
jgi:methanethiol oxidase